MADPDPSAAPEARRAKRIALLGIGASLALAISNLAIGWVACSRAVFATGLEFAGDVVASAVVFLGMLVAVRPADRNHPYGHGRFETLAAFVVGLILAGGGVLICWTSLQGIGEDHAPPGAPAVAALLVAIALRGLMALLKFRAGRRLRSSALVADAWNDAVDILAAAVALTAVGLARHDPDRFLAADHYGGFAVGIIVILTGLRVLRDASLELADTMPAAELIAAARRTAAAVEGVRAVEKTFARKTGFQYHVDLHIHVDPRLTVAAAHDIAGQVRAALRQLPWVADVLVHVEPDEPFAS